MEKIFFIKIGVQKFKIQKKIQKIKKIFMKWNILKFKQLADQNNVLFCENKLLINQILNLINYNLVRDFIIEQQLKDIKELKQKIIFTDSLNINQIESKHLPHISEISGLLNWPLLLKSNYYYSSVSTLVKLILMSLNSGAAKQTYSQCWTLLGKKNYEQLLDYGYHNFKRTVTSNYFNFLVQKNDPQILFLEKYFPEEVLEKCCLNVKKIKTVNDGLPDPESYFYFLFLLYEYVKGIDKYNYLDLLDEPKEGNPLGINMNNRLVTQDLVNSLVEYYSILEFVPIHKVQTMMEIGGGYGRNAFVFLKLNPNLRWIVIDIMPALYISQRYLCSVFEDRKIFHVQDFEDYEQVKHEIDNAKIIFLMPHQLELLPKNYIDFTINISSFGEMTREQLSWYYEQIQRTTTQYFYSKQWKISKNPFDQLELTQDDYPKLAGWKEQFFKECEIQKDFFEILFLRQYMDM